MLLRRRVSCILGTMFLSLCEDRGFPARRVSGWDLMSCTACLCMVSMDIVWMKCARSGCFQTGMMTSSTKSKYGDVLTSSGISPRGGG